MKALTQAAVRKSFINASRSQTAAVNFPADFDTIDWENIDQYGWRDHKMPQRAYLVLDVEGKTTTVLLRAPELVSASKKALCALCEDMESDDDVFMFVAPKAGPAGKNGNSVGTLIHSNFSCAQNVRSEPKPDPIHPDPELVKAERARRLQERTVQFVRKIRS
ncbi:FBP domain-containing protein [Arthrobacter caoxuetaonis]|uniref:FBP domain-containing protein n=1 Tax=Arthrobacter caoxuetaonis TaxID=2886935 RepID=A0A9X1MF97_9MICC|nr:FBP domain-containing protein [Arthrobacter caoxuetaonis]MCC3283621.1 FBP domain-containing protein [Arthrobacter caoxuetaonis]MCC3299019.1 FBP domain-containing protein [Arthrobacter caoxuetaonis]USQ58640.1 FBP domain-containing protein [Arthrobacter caoxuetaonis]